jgi:hypothetical protein
MQVHGTRHAPLIERFWAKVDRNGPVPELMPELGSCWLWTGSTTKGGYGKYGIKVDGAGVYFMTHRKAWELATESEPPTGLRVCHICDVRRCVRNDSVGFYEINGVLLPRRGHLWIGTQAENMQDAAKKGRLPVGSDNWSATHREEIGIRNRRRAIEHPETFARGEQSGGAKLTDAAVREIRSSDEYWEALSERFGVSRTTIYRIRQRKDWLHVQ